MGRQPLLRPYPLFFLCTVPKNLKLNNWSCAWFSVVRATAYNLWLRCPRIWIRDLHFSKWCLQLWCGDAGTLNWQNVIWPVTPFASHWVNFCCVVSQLYHHRYIIFRTRSRGEQFLVRWAIPQLHDIDALTRMVDPSLKGKYPLKSLSHFADIISRCVQVSFLIRSFITN